MAYPADADQAPSPLTADQERPMLKRRAILAALLVPLAGGAPLAQSARFAVDVTWEGTALCFVMKDLDAPNFPHGGGSAPYRGQSRIERGAFTYQGPCPPSGQHTYQWTVEAQDASGKTLATATATKKFPPGDAAAACRSCLLRMTEVIVPCQRLSPAPLHPSVTRPTSYLLSIKWRVPEQHDSAGL